MNDDKRDKPRGQYTQVVDEIHHLLRTILSRLPSPGDAPDEAGDQVADLRLEAIQDRLRSLEHRADDRDEMMRRISNAWESIHTPLD